MSVLRVALGQFSYLHTATAGVVVFDWQTWHVDLPTHDLAYFMGVWWSSTKRRHLEDALLQLYLAEINKRGIEYSSQGLFEDYRLSVVKHLFTPVVLSKHPVPKENDCGQRPQHEYCALPD